MALETRLAEGHWEACRDPRRAEDLQPQEPRRARRQLRPAFDWVAWVTALGGTEETLAEVIVAQPELPRDLSRCSRRRRSTTWRDWLHARIIRSAAPYLPEAFVETNFDFYGRTLNGTPELRERWKRGVAFVEGAIGEAVGAVYVARHFPPTAKAEMDELVDNLVAAYRSSSSQLDWMGEDTKQQAFDKLEQVPPQDRLPRPWRDYSALDGHPGRPDRQRAPRSAAFETDRQLGKVGQPVDREEW